MIDTIKKELEDIKKSKKGLAEIFCNFLKDVEPEDVMAHLGAEDGNILRAYFTKDGKNYYISIELDGKQ